jgi:hypothetical protein
VRVVGTATNTATGETTTFAQKRVAAPLQVTRATREILDLTIGPIHLHLLCLVVETNEIRLEIRAEQGPETCSAIFCASLPVA